MSVCSHAFKMNYLNFLAFRNNDHFVVYFIYFSNILVILRKTVVVTADESHIWVMSAN